MQVGKSSPMNRCDVISIWSILSCKLRKTREPTIIDFAQSSVLLWKPHSAASTSVNYSLRVITCWLQKRTKGTVANALKRSLSLTMVMTNTSVMNHQRRRWCVNKKGEKFSIRKSDWHASVSLLRQQENEAKQYAIANNTASVDGWASVLILIDDFSSISETVG